MRHPRIYATKIKPDYFRAIVKCQHERCKIFGRIILVHQGPLRDENLWCESFDKATPRSHCPVCGRFGALDEVMGAATRLLSQSK